MYGSCSTRSPDLNALCAQALPGVTRRARMLLPASAVDDVVQETFLAAVGSLHLWRRDASFRTWLEAILRHRVADYYRQHERRIATVSLEAVGDVHPLRSDYQIGADVRMTLADLPPADRDVLRLRFADGLRFTDVARKLGVSLEAAKSRYRRAVVRFTEAWNA